MTILKAQQIIKAYEAGKLSNSAINDRLYRIATNIVNKHTLESFEDANKKWNRHNPIIIWKF